MTVRKQKRPSVNIEGRATMIRTKQDKIGQNSATSYALQLPDGVDSSSYKVRTLGNAPSRETIRAFFFNALWSKCFAGVKDCDGIHVTVNLIDQRSKYNSARTTQ